MTDEEKLQLSTEDKLKMIADYIDKMTDEEFEKNVDIFLWIRIA